MGDRRLRPEARYLYMVLLRHCSPGVWQCRLSLPDLLVHTGFGSTNTVRSHLARLEREGWLSIKKARSHRPTLYALHTPHGPVSAELTVAVPASLITLPPLSPGAKCLYAALLARREPGTRKCAARQLEVLRWSGLGSDNTLRGQLERLQQAGWLQVHRNPGASGSTYELLDPHRAAREAELERVKLRLGREAFKGEAVMKELLNVRVADNRFQDNARPGFLVNPLTGERLELDRYYLAGVALEFNGRQHYGPTGAFPDPGEARQQRLRDLVKDALARQYGVHLVVVHPEDLTFERLAEKLKGLLPLRELRKEDPVVGYLDKVSKAYVRKATRGEPGDVSPAPLRP
ncbi:hypothetical protein caldi_31780 [Caldinitratiruptor microaerophilus]|uniref:Uncharacterized protein n=1 Tax=Caldinitratiruptor microaerophilus TaxID=671077 RepID=A0AA35GA29_9FIRM|nr:hypothetical protein caldi_31780 [Caldinitratiruptor microaerophilus]